MKVLPFFLLSCALFFVACASSEVLPFTTEEVSMLASGPLMEGSNTAQGDYQPALEKWLQSKGAKMADVREAKLVKASLVLPGLSCPENALH